ncbi:MAG: AAA family ATPase [Candidatus Magasanikbacteria bacterium]
MKIIKEIRIENFRSFLGTTIRDEAVVLNVRDLNIFSGANDSGKSNVLRALNLFFNDEIGKGKKFFHPNDLNINKRNAGNRVVKIKIDFDISWDNNRDKFLPTKFSISKFYDVNGFRNYWYEFKLKNIKKTIRIDSIPEKNKDVYTLFLPDNFKELTTSKKEQVEEQAKKREWNYRVKFSGFLNRSLSFQYVPAIKEESFFSYLYGKTILLLMHNEENSLEGLEKQKKIIENWKTSLERKSIKSDLKRNLKNEDWRKSEIKDIDNKIKSTAKLKNSIKALEEEINNFSASLFNSSKFLVSEFRVSNDLREFFESFDIGTGNEKNISLKLRGDGIQARFIPQILNFLDSIQKGKKYFLWGFEEPENSSEYKNQQELAKSLKETFSKDKQIFVTTHSEEFLSIYDGSDINPEDRKANLYHVKKISNKEHKDFSTISLFDVDKHTFDFGTTKSALEEDLGTSLIRAKYAKELKEKESAFIKEKEMLEKVDGPTLFVEGSLEEKVFKKTFGDALDFNIKAAGGSDPLANSIIAKSFDSGHKVYGLFDKDGAGKAAVKKISEKRNPNTKVKNGYIKPNTPLKNILQKVGIDFTLDELLPDNIWEYLDSNDFLENAEKFERNIIPEDKSLNNFLSEKFGEDKVAILKASKKIKTAKKEEFEKYILQLNEDEFRKIEDSLKETLEEIKKYFND